VLPHCELAHDLSIKSPTTPYYFPTSVAQQQAYIYTLTCDRPFFGQLHQVVTGDGCLASSRRSNEQQWNFVRQVDLEKVRLTRGVYRRNDEITELYM